MPEPRPAADEEIELGADGLRRRVPRRRARSTSARRSPTRSRSALDPYPRSAGAEAALKEAGVLSEEEAGPFAALAELKTKLGGSEP